MGMAGRECKVKNNALKQTRSFEMSGGREYMEGTVVVTRKQCWDCVRGGPRLESSRKNCQRKLLENKRWEKMSAP